MEQILPAEAPETVETAATEKRPQKLTLKIIIEGMMQTRRDIEAYNRGEMTKEEFDALGIKLF
ncbi:hypothetical protein GCM10010967_13750 [Dyadobacter beijingensis]|uniref:SHOCT domain-containing protein n=1 Tax=Dyadobacter beijingensis TaxID=365489 RepID=A0ABQ2HIX1_9BACT|nr:hypothetical protein [Dyadobacter beijingensis]GGM83274.1 hypothetical protein GCM10010967_13750 [Dyadobacter beijingensis]